MITALSTCFLLTGAKCLFYTLNKVVVSVYTIHTHKYVHLIVEDVLSLVKIIPLHLVRFLPLQSCELLFCYSCS